MKIMAGDELSKSEHDLGKSARAGMAGRLVDRLMADGNAESDFLRDALRTVQSLVAEGMEKKESAWAGTAILLEHALTVGRDALALFDATAGEQEAKIQPDAVEPRMSVREETARGAHRVGVAVFRGDREVVGSRKRGADGSETDPVEPIAPDRIKKERGLVARLALETSRAAKTLSALMGEQGRADLALDEALEASRLALRAVREAKEAGEVFTILAAMLQRSWSLFRMAEELQIRLGQVDEALDRYDQAVDCLGRAAVLTQSREFKELAELVEFPADTVGTDVAVTQARMQSVAAQLEWSRRNRPAQAVRRYDKAAATGLRGASSKLPEDARLLKQQALEAAGSALAEGARIVEETVGLGGDTRRRYFLASKILGQAARQASQDHRALEAARLYVAASQAAYRSALSSGNDDDGANRSYASASDMARKAADILGAQGQVGAEVQALLAAGRILVVQGRHMERAGRAPEDVIACFREAVGLARRRTMSGELSEELDRLAKDAESAMSRTMAKTGRWRRDAIHEVIFPGKKPQEG